jgi:hypothetical protein
MEPAGEGMAILVSEQGRVKQICRGGKWPRIPADARGSETASGKIKQQTQTSENNNQVVPFLIRAHPRKSAASFSFTAAAF